MYKYMLWDPNESRYSMWELKHVESFKASISKSSQARGIPTKSSSATQVFEMQGPVATFELSFIRFDYEEDVPNWDFLFTKDYIVRSSSNPDNIGKKYKGIDWYTARLQTTRPYRFAIAWVPDSIDSEEDPELIPTGSWNVAVTNITYDVDSTQHGMGSFRINLTERR